MKTKLNPEAREMGGWNCRCWDGWKESQPPRKRHPQA